MSDYLQIAAEIEEIDRLLEQQYQFKSIVENLDGAYIELENIEKDDCVSIHISTADARKYFSMKVFEQMYE